MDTSKKKTPNWLGYILKYLVPLVITVGLCWLLFTGMDFRQMWHIIVTQCDFRWIAAALCVSVLSHVVRAARWRIQLAALDIRPSMWVTTLSIFGTYAVNLVLPRLGEIWRTGWIAKRQDAQFTKVFGSMVADRLADTVTVALLTLVTFLLAGNQLMSYLEQNSASTAEKIISIFSSPWFWTGVVVTIALIVVLVRHYRNTKFISKIITALRDLWHGFAVVATMPGKGRWLLLTVGIWGCYFSQLWLAFYAFPLTTQVIETYGLLAVLVCFVLSSISMGVPSNGGIGPWQWAIIFGLSLYPIAGLDKEYATTFANLVMGTQTLMLIVLGIITFVWIAFDRKRHTPNNNA